MLSKTNLISTIVTGLWAFLGGYLLWGILGEPILSGHEQTTGLMKDPVDFFHLALGCFILGLAFSVIYGKWATGTYSVSSGIIFGFWIAILHGLGDGLIDFSTANLLDLSGTLMNFIIYLVFYVIMGALASFVFKKTSG